MKEQLIRRQFRKEPMGPSKLPSINGSEEVDGPGNPSNFGGFGCCHMHASCLLMGSPRISAAVHSIF
jgi:hypothetical protein